MRDLTEIEAFVQVVKAGGFLAAQRKLGVSKSTLSRKVALLETRLGTSLLERTTRFLKLTASGEIYFNGCSDALTEIDRIEQITKETQSEPRGLIRITAPVELANDGLSEMLVEFQKQYPLIEIYIDLSDRVVDLLAEQFDLAFRAGVLPDSSALTARKIGQEDFRLYCAPFYHEQIQQKITQPQDLKKVKCVVYDMEEGLGSWELQSKTKGKSKIKIEPSVRTNSLNMSKKIVLAGGGVGLLPSFMCKQEVMTGELMPILKDWYAYSEYFYLVYAKKKYTPPRVKLLVEFLTEKLKARWRT